MAEAEQTQGKGLTWSRSLETIIGESVPVYLAKYVLPTAAMGVLAALLLQILMADLLGNLAPATLVIPVALTAIVLLYPKMLADRRRIDIEQNMHLFITHLGAMSITGIPRVDVLEAVAREEEYGAISDEVRKIVELVKTWNLALDEAAKFQAERTPSPLFADFLERLAYNIGAGQELEEFLTEEQDVVMSQYATMYKGAMEDVELLQDLFLSMVLSVAFVVVFAIIIPVLTGNNPVLLLFGSIVLYGFIELGFLYTAYIKVPEDPIWWNPDREVEYESIVERLTAGLGFAAIGGTSTKLERRVRKALTISIASASLLTLLSGAIYTGVIALPLEVPLPVYFAIPITPLAYPGLVIRQEEQRIKKRDQAFPSFIRSLGASEHVKQSTTTKVLESLRHKDFGALTPQVRNLYKRLNMRIDQDLAWRHFALESHSFLIQKFSEMYNRGRTKGGNTQRLGNLIADNLGEILELRQKRHQTSVTLIGVLYGMTASMTFAYFVGVEVVKLMLNIMNELDLSGLGQIGQLLHTEGYDIPEVSYLILLFVLLNAVLSSVMIRIVDGGHQINSYPHLVGLTWTGSLIAVVTEGFVSSFIQLGV